MFFLYASYRSFTRNSWWSKKCDFIFSTYSCTKFSSTSIYLVDRFTDS
eukprot:SAG11_NODE_608_length_8226_cov_4.489603_7_plen_48_part_00